MASEQEPVLTEAADLIEAHILPKLDPDFVSYFVNVVSKNNPAQAVPIEEVRASPDKYRAPCALDATGYEGVVDKEVVGSDGTKIPVKVYYPDSSKHGRGPYPAHLNFHGGGFVLGNLSSESTLCLRMREAGVAVVDVNYRHCPETTWGHCIEDAWAALLWTRSESLQLNLDADSVSIGGISAGGHISFVLQHKARDARINLKLCLASVPSATDALSYKYYTESPYASFHEFHRSPVLPWARIQWFGKLCMPQDKLTELRATWPDWWFAPVRAPDWKGLCDTFIRTAEIDPLRDEGEAYGMKLVANGNKVTMKRYLGAPHTFMYLDFMKQKQAYDADAIDALKKAHGLD